MFEKLARGIRCISDTVSICFMCRMMDQLPGDNIGKAVVDYGNCIGNGFKNCCTIITSKCTDYCNNNPEGQPIQLLGADSVEGQA